MSVFGQLSTPPTAEVQSRWIAFANTLNPNVAGYPYWPQYGTDGTLLQFTDTKDPSSLVPDDFREAPSKLLSSKFNYSRFKLIAFLFTISGLFRKYR